MSLSGLFRVISSGLSCVLLGLIQRLLAQIARILRINELHLVTKEVVDIARESLVIGVT
jgi:hypothetical protein